MNTCDSYISYQKQGKVLFVIQYQCNVSVSSPLASVQYNLCLIYYLFAIVISLQLTVFTSTSSLQYTVFNCQGVCLQFCEAQQISAISPKIGPSKLQLLHNTERPTKWSAHRKMIDPPGELLHTKDLLPGRVTI